MSTQNLPQILILFILSLCKQTNDVSLHKFSLPHAWSTHLSKVIKSHNKIIYTAVNIKTEMSSTYPKLKGPGGSMS